VTLRVVFMGTPEFSVPILKALHREFELVGVVTQPDKPRGRGRKPSPTPVKAKALELGVSVTEPQKVSSDDSLALLRELNPDVIVVAAYGAILPESILSLPSMGCVNLHASLLPKHRGAAPINAAILAGDEIGGVCTIMMDKGMDTGDILLSCEIPIRPDDTAGSLHDRMLEPAANLVLETLVEMEAGRIERIPQDHAQATYTRPLTKADAEIDWSARAEQIDRLIRAMNPWPTAFTHLADMPIKVWKAEPRPGRGALGTITEIGKKGALVGSGDGLLLLKEVQAPGKKRMPAGDFLRGRRLGVGTVFGDPP
jgi:methionyl-tRNA formyltransferase